MSDVLRIILLFGLAGITHGVNSLRVDAQPHLRALQQAGDSLEIEIAWTPAGPAQYVVGYTIAVSGQSGWQRGSSTPMLADTLWIPLVPGGERVVYCTQANYGTLAGNERCDTWQAPPVVLTPPGVPTLRIISQSSVPGFAFDSAWITLAGRRVEVDTLPRVGDSRTYRAVGWLGGLPWLCVTQDDGSRGWLEADPSFHPDMAGSWIPDPGCSWVWRSSDPSTLTVRVS